MPGSTASSGSDQWPFTGRERELEEIANARTDPSCRGVVIAAGAGVGKSRLAREAVAAAARSRVHTRWVTATRSAATVPLAAVAELVPDDIGSDDIVALMRRCSEGLRAAGGGRPIVLAVDDAQLLDQVSATLVLHLATSGAAFVLATVRTGQPCPDAVTALWKDEGARRIELADFDEAQIEQLVENALGAPVQAQALEWLRSVGEGNALYVRELIRGAVEAGTLALIDGFWRLEGTPAASGSLVELVGMRLAALGDGQREALQLLALGEPLHVGEIIGLTSEDAVLELEEHGLLRATGHSIGLAHPLHGETALSSLLPLRARRMRLALADVVRAREPLTEDDALRAARLLFDAGEQVPPDLALIAAGAANRSGDPDLGAELAIAAGASRSVRATLLLARAHVLRNRYEEADAALASVESLAPADADRVEYLRQRLWVLHWGLRRSSAQTTELLDRASEWSDDEFWAQTIARIRVTFAAFSDGYGDPEQYRPSEDPRVSDAGRRSRVVVHTMARFMSGECDQAADAAFALRPTVPLHDATDAAMLATLVIVTIDSGYRLPEVTAYMSEALRAGVRSHDHAAAGLAALGLARLRFLSGANRDAMRWAAEAEVHLQRHDPFNATIGLRSLRVGIAAAGGDFDATMAALGQLRAWVSAHPPQPPQRVPVRRAEGWALRLRSPADAGKQLLRDAEELSDQPPLAAQLAYDALLAGAPAAGTLRRFQARCDSRLVGAYAAHAAAREGRDGMALMSAGEEMAAIGADRYAVEAFTDAATAFLAQGRQDSARRAAARSRQLHPENQDGVLPVIDGLDATAIALTPREAQLVSLASQGLSNAEIADRLVISVRTVETHLYRGMQKLGISDRRDLVQGTGGH